MKTTKIKNLSFILMALMAVVMLPTAFAAIDGCGPDASTYNDTGVLTNVSAGNVCINATDYDVDPTAAVYCSNTWANYTDGACSYTRYYVGYAGDGTLNCSATGWVVRDASVFLGEGYIVNGTIDGPVTASYITNTGEVVPAKDACLNAYTRMGPTGYCSGAGVLDTNGSLANVTDGNVCISGADTDPTAGVRCAQWSQCVAGACTTGTLNVGYSVGNATGCSGTDAQAGVGTGVVSAGYKVNATVNASSCTFVDTVSLTYSTCTNLYTRTGSDSLCDGAGTLRVNSTHVADGKICLLGANTAPNGSLKCGVWSECVATATTAPEHNVGYAASGTACSATAWTATSPATVQTAPNGQAWRTTENVDSCAVYGYVSVYDKTDVKNIVVDGIGVSGAATVEWLDLIVLLVVLGFMIGIFVKLGNMFK